MRLSELVVGLLLVVVAPRAPASPGEPESTAADGWRLAEDEVGARWHSIRGSMPCRTLPATPLGEDDLLAPLLLLGLNWTDLHWWRKASLLSSIGHAPVGLGNPTELSKGPWADLQTTSLDAIFSSSPPLHHEGNAVFDSRFRDHEHAAPLGHKVWLQKSLKGIIDIRPDLFFLSALPVGRWRGVSFHQHGRSASALAVGRKLWLFFPDGSSTMARQMERQGTGLSVPALWDWVAGNASLEGFEELPAPSVCAQEAGEVMFVPNYHHHGTLPVGDALGVALVEQGPRPNEIKEEL